VPNGDVTLWPAVLIVTGEATEPGAAATVSRALGIARNGRVTWVLSPAGVSVTVLSHPLVTGIRAGRFVFGPVLSPCHRLGVYVVDDRSSARPAGDFAPPDIAVILKYGYGYRRSRRGGKATVHRSVYVTLSERCTGTDPVKDSARVIDRRMGTHCAERSHSVFGPVAGLGNGAGHGLFADRRPRPVVGVLAEVELPGDSCGRAGQFGCPVA
jgi:hypothetical protein